MFSNLWINDENGSWFTWELFLDKVADKVSVDSVAITDSEQMKVFSSHEVVLDNVDILIVLLWRMRIPPFLRLIRNQ